MSRTSFLAAFLCGASTLTAADHIIHAFHKIQLTDQFWGEGANIGDFNRDGKVDVASGPYWWAGPDFKLRHEYYPATQTFKRKKADGTEEAVPGFEGALGKNNTYSDNFFAFSYDLNKDRWDDILILGFPGKESAWYENPQGKPGHWKKHIALAITDNESPTFADITGDARPEIICNSEGFYGYAEPDWSDATKPWAFRRITPKGPWQRFTHGLGFGDVNGDRKLDLLEKDGWWEQPATSPAAGEWKHHPYPFSPGSGGAHMYAYDVDGDGDNDVITSIAAHGYGLAWYEHVKEGGNITFKPHVFMNKEPSENKYGVKFSQLHAIDLVDMDRDGLLDIITGKRFWAHGPLGDAEPNAAAVLYWFKLVRNPDRTVDYVPYLIDNDSGVGTQLVATDINGDPFPDLVVGNKKGTFVFLHEVRKVSEEEWRNAQPKPL